MLNIITTDFSEINGPAKVVQNLIKGLEKIKYPYVINKDINATQRCYIPNRRTALLKLRKAKSRVIVGPNLFLTPYDIPWYISLRDTIYLQPSHETIESWELFGFNHAPMKVWATGIDTDSFYPVKCNNRKVTIYHKCRKKKELNQIENTLKEMGIDYYKVIYGGYNEKEYKEILKNTSFIIWHGHQESQGIALQEALASDIPILVCDVASWRDQVPRYSWPKPMHNLLDKLRVTAVPYFDDRCGIKIIDLTKLKEAIEYMQDNLTEFQPREFIIENLSLEKQAKELISLYDRWGLHVEEGYGERLLSNEGFSDNRIIRVADAVCSKCSRWARSYQRYLHR